MLKIKYCILGAGPSGLTFANKLIQNGESSFVVVEKESTAGGLCRSKTVDGYPLDIGGGHFLDIRRKNVLEFLFQFMPLSEWQEYDRVSKIKILGTEVNHPLESHLWQLKIEDQINFLESIAQAGCVSGQPEPSVFDEWIRWKLGNKIAEEYMLPYNRKVFSHPLEELGTYWLHKLPNVSFRETLDSCLNRRSTGQLPAHGVFLYPKKHGYGEVWSRMGKNLKNHLSLEEAVVSIDYKNKIINNHYRYDKIINTIPWSIWDLKSELPEKIRISIKSLKYSSIDVDYFPEDTGSAAHWTYDPDETKAHHRILHRHNFCTGSRGYWTETNSSRAIESTSFRYRNEFAYPINTTEKLLNVGIINEWALENDIVPLGRWGTWEHMNSDVAVDLALTAVKKYS